MSKRKIGAEERIAIAKKYLRGEASYQKIGKQYGIGETTVKDIVAVYNAEGEEGFTRLKNKKYSKETFHQKLMDAGIRQSMSRVGRCIDNGPMEGYWGILKSEMYYLRKFTDREELSKAIENYIHFYNTKRYQFKLNCMTPLEFHTAFAA